MSRRYRAVALQAVAVLILAAVIFAAFLRPTEPGPLSGIDAPGGRDGPTVAKPGRSDDEMKATKNADPGLNRDTPRAEDEEPFGGTFPAGPGDDGFTSPGGDGGPTDDQYIDAATLLLKRVARPTLREIEP